MKRDALGREHHHVNCKQNGRCSQAHGLAESQPEPTQQPISLRDASRQNIPYQLNNINVK